MDKLLKKPKEIALYIVVSIVAYPLALIAYRYMKDGDIYVNRTGQVIRIKRNRSPLLTSLWNLDQCVAYERYEPSRGEFVPFTYWIDPNIELADYQLIDKKMAKVLYG